MVPTVAIFIIVCEFLLEPLPAFISFFTMKSELFKFYISVSVTDVIFINFTNLYKFIS